MDEKTIETLNKLGLTRNDSMVYACLLELGKAGAGEIIRKTSIQSSRVHESLPKLEKLGLISYVVSANRKIYQAQKPEAILTIAQEIEDNAKLILPELNQLIRYSEKAAQARIFQGYKGLKALFEMVLELKKGEEHLVFSAVRVPEWFNAYFVHWNKRRIEKGIGMRIAFSKDMIDQVKETAKELVEYKVVPKEFTTPAVINIFGSTVAIILWIDEPLAFVIENDEAAKSFRQYFEVLWNYGFEL